MFILVHWMAAVSIFFRNIELFRPINQNDGVSRQAAECRGMRYSSIHSCLLYFLKGSDIMEWITEVADCRFFTAIQHPEHCINCILHDVKECSADLRHKRHQYKLPQYKYDIYKKSFIPRCLFQYI